MAKPTIRFKGYTDDWEQRKLGDVFKEYSEKNHTELPALTIIQGGGTVKREDSDRNLMYDKSNLSNYKMVRKDDFIVHLRSFEGGLEKASSDGIISPAYHTFHSDVADSRFYYPYFRSHEFIKHKLVPHVYGIRDGRSIDIDGMKTIEIPYTSTEEQQKIGDYLESIDHHITLHQRITPYFLKINAFVWEQRKLGDVLERRIEQRQQSEEYPRLAFASGQGVIPLSERKTNNREQLTKDEYTKKYLVTELNDIVYNPANVKYGAIDRNKCGRGLISPIYVTFTTNEIPGFIERIVTSHDFQQRALRFEEGTVTKRQSVNPEDLVTLDILVAPKREEQQKIATYFDSLDHLITLHQRKPYFWNKFIVIDWEQRKLGDSCKLNGRIGFRGYTEKDIISKEAGGVLTFSPTNIVDNKLTIECKNTYITREKYDESPEIKISNGDILFVKTGSTLGKSALVAGLKEDASINPKIVVMHVEKDTENFMSNVLITDRVMKQVAAVKIGGAVPTMTETELKNFTYFAPAEKEEKKKIGDHFRTLDNLITLHQRKCEETKILKKYMLQKMFPQNGQKVPEIRFKGFTDDWEQRKLGDLVDRVTRKNQDLVSELPLTISAQYGLIDQNEFFDKRVASKDVSGYYLIENGEFAYNKSTSTDAPWGAIKRLDRYENGVLSTLYIVFGIKANNPIDSDFLVSYYSTNLWHKGIHEIAAEGARNHGLLNIAPADFFETKLMIPQDIEEQKKIGKYFEELERLITLHQRKCEELQNIKKFMLQNMFV